MQTTGSSEPSEELPKLYEEPLPQTAQGFSSMTSDVLKRASLSHSHQLIKRWLLGLSVVFCVSMWILFQMDLKLDRKMILPGVYQPDGYSGNTEGFAVDTKGCRIPQLIANDSSIVEFLEGDHDEVVCDKNGTGTLVDSNLTSIYINPVVINAYTKDPSALKCCYESFKRVLLPVTNKYEYDVDRKHKYSGKCIYFTDSAEIEDEFIRVTCTVNGKSVYKDFFAFVHPPPIETVQLKEGNVNILILGIDAVSKMNFERQMPKTYSYLLNELKAVEMQGYNKVGDNTFPNLVPALTGLSEKELTESCWPNDGMVFDGCPFIWKMFKGKGFITGFGEDSANIGLFNYLKLGFHEQPTDIYLQTFNLVAEREIGHDHRLNCNLCMGKRLNLQVLLDTIKKFTVSLKGFKSFGFFWETSLTHDFLNLPRFGDDPYLNLLQELKTENILNNTILIILSDHGIRWGAIRETYQGYLEERLPFLFFVFPNWFQEKYSRAVFNIKYNRNRLTTPFDLHETLIDLSDLKRIEDDELEWRSKDPQLLSWSERGISLFMKISGERTCKRAGIDDNWCTCHQSERISVLNQEVVRASNALVRHINEMLSGYRECAQLRLLKVHTARKQTAFINQNDKIKEKNIQLVDFSLTIEALPGNGLFEATVRWNRHSNAFYVVGVVSRLNTYGSQSRCMLYYKLKLYCFCQDQLS